MSEKKQAPAIMVGKWAVGLDTSHDLTLLRFDFADVPAITLAISRGDAEQIAKVMLDQLQKSPAKRGKMN